MNLFEKEKNEAIEKIAKEFGKDQLNEWMKFYKPKEDYVKFESSKNISDEDYRKLSSEIKRVYDYLCSTLEQIKKDQVDSYTASDLVKFTVIYQDLLKKQTNIEKNHQEQNTVKKYFGNFSADKNGRAKTTEELEQERNERLAVLGELRAKGEISKMDFVEAVVAVRRVYSRELQDEQVNEILRQENNLQKDTSLIKKIANKIKKFFKIKKEKETIEFKSYNDEIINQNAREALVYASEILKSSELEEYQKESVDLLNDSIDIETSPFHIEITDELAEAVNIIYREKNPDCETTEDKENLTDSLLSVGLCYNIKDGRSVLKTHEEVMAEKEGISKRLLEVLNGKSTYVLNKNEWSITFDNPENEKKYYEIMDQYTTLEQEIAKREPFKDIVKDKSEIYNSKSNNK